MKKIITFILLLGGVFIAQEMNNYCTAPPFVGGKTAVVRPYVLLIQDMTGSMRFWAYHYWNEPYNPSFTYYGYANPNYTYDSVNVGGNWYFVKHTGAGSGKYSGNQINYAFMTRMDIARKAFTGGKGIAYNNKSRLLFEVPSVQNGFGSKTWYGIVTSDSTERTKGIIREIADKDDDYVWDSDAPGFALLTFSTSSRFYERVKCTFDSSLIRLLTVYENHDGQNQPTGGTPTGNAIFEAIHYLRFQSGPHFARTPVNYTWNASWVGTPRDPWFEVVGGDTVSVSCRPMFAIVIGDGGSNSDAATITCNHLPWYDSPYGSNYNAFWKYAYDYDYANNPYNGIDPYDDCDGSNNPPAPSPIWGHDRPADDYAYYAHVNDLRNDIPDNQTINFYTIYLFARGEDNDADSMLFRHIAKHGGFVDSDFPGSPGYKKYDKQSEYDSNNDGRPDHFYYIQDGQALEDALNEIFVDIQTIARVTSASATSVSGGGTKGAGFVVSSQFWPRLQLPNYDLKWLGTVQSLWVDDSGLVREETQGNNRLHLKQDNVVKMFFSTQFNRTMAARFRDTAGISMESLLVPLDTVPVESLNFIWNAGNLLRTTLPANRTIYTNLGGLLAPFVTTNNTIDQHLGFHSGNADSCDKLINYIRGTDYNKWRRRLFTDGNVWKLGDIIYSQPMLVGSPSESYDLIYNDGTYNIFWNQYKDRRIVVYAGANDGMLHAFNSGKYNRLGGMYEIAEIDPLNKPLGQELWAYIPFNLLPQLKWLRDSTYCHVPYVDLKPYPTDVRIFPSDVDHPQGWGTVLIAGMRQGGYPITVGSNTYRSSYSCFDITNPESNNYPRLLWEFTRSDLGLTFCVPTMVKCQNNWYLVFGSGPQSLVGEVTQRGRIFVLNPYTGDTVRTIMLNDTCAITNIFAADWGLNYSTELIYFGTMDKNNKGKIYRIKTRESHPSNWVYEQVINLNKPVTAEGSVATDEYGRLWIYFGSGKYISNPDAANKDTMVFIGIRDDTTRGTATVPAFTYNDLFNVTNVKVFDDSVSGAGPGIDTWDDLVNAVNLKQGWFIRFLFTTGERVITAPVVLGGAVIFTTFIPSDTTQQNPTGPDLCIGGSGGPSAGNLWVVYYITGTAYKTDILGKTTTGEHKRYVPVIGDLPSEPALVIGPKQEKVFIQTSGGIKAIQTPLPFNPRGGVMIWRGR
ncbi:MAG: PilC/PilY family type IV pilus protein [candidate division WOR-3 bacterium]